jgi:type IV secretion system protein VirD4
MFGKWPGRVMLAHGLYQWAKDRKLREANTGRVLSNKELGKLLSPKHNGLTLDGAGGRLTDDASFRNLAVIAGTGAGKTSSFIVPNLLTLDNASIVATDPSGTLYARTAGDLARRGYTVYQLNPLDLAASIRFNPIDRAKTATEIQEIAHVLVQTANGDAKTDPFWLSGAETILTILIKCLKDHVDADKYANLANLHYLLNSFGDGEAISPFIAANALDDLTYQEFKSFIGQSEKTMQGIISQAKMALTKLADPDMQILTAGQSFDFSLLRKKKTALFLVFPQNRIGFYSFLANLFYTQLFHHCLDDRNYDAKSLPIYFLLDEFGHLRLPDFPAIITTTRQRRISISIVLQSESQLEERYGRAGAETILDGGLGSRLYFPGMDINTASELSRMIGDVYIDRMEPSGRVRTDKSPLMEPASIRAMAKNEVLFLHAGERPGLLEVTPYFERKDFERRTKTAQPKPHASVSSLRPPYVPL